MAEVLAKKGLNVLLVSRTPSKLQEVKDDILRMTKETVKVDTLAIDFDNFDGKKQKDVEAAISKINVGVLVNNVGMSYKFAKYFHELDMGDVDQMTRLNVDSTGRMTYIVLQHMLAKQKKNKGCIVNMSSSAARFANPLLAQYSGTKGYIENLTASLATEYGPKGVQFQCQSPLFVTTKLAKIQRKYSSVTTPTPEIYAKSAVAHIGYETLVSPYWAHALMLAVARHLPDFVLQGGLMSMHLKIRSKGRKKDEKLAAEKGSKGH